MGPDPNAIVSQLERVLSSDAFATAGRHSRLLRYLVERTLAGEGEQLKEYVLGTEVFDRPDSYDPRLDSIVRVEVRRLRNRLEDYYQAGGAADPIIISIPRGSYAPTFTERGPSVQVPAANVATDRRSYSPMAIIAAALSVAMVIVAAGIAFNNARLPAQASSGPGLAVLPFEHYATEPGGVQAAARLTDAVTTELARLGTVSVASRTSASQYTAQLRPVGEIAKALNVVYVIEGSAVANGDDLRVVVRLVDARIDRKVWVGEYRTSVRDIAAIARTIATEAADAALR